MAQLYVQEDERQR